MKRKVLSVILSICLISSLLPSVSLKAVAEDIRFGGGNGTENEPYFISDEDDFRQLAS